MSGHRSRESATTVVLRSLLVGMSVLMGCSATVDVYRYRPHALPSGAVPMDVVLRSLRDLTHVNWNYDPEPLARRARVAADAHGLSVVVQPSTSVLKRSVYLTYAEIVRNVIAVTQHDGRWTVLVGFGVSQIELQFTNMRSARMFLDAATEMVAGGPSRSLAAR